jgi:hypothetical protein
VPSASKKVSAENVEDFLAVKKNKAGAWSRFNHAPNSLREGLRKFGQGRI